MARTSTTILNTRSDIQWSREVHAKDMPDGIRFVILYGNEDSPSQIEGWYSRNPHYQARPDYSWSPVA